MTRRITGPAREALIDDILRMYTERRLPIRAICQTTGMSYGFVHRVLERGGVTFRERGGDHGPFARTRT
jgi:hypothetical protein